MDTEGIYRISGHAQDTLLIKEKFDKGILIQYEFIERLMMKINIQYT